MSTKRFRDLVLSTKTDRWFLGLAEYVSTASKDPSTKTGAVIIAPDKSIISVGYNGFPSGMSDDPALYADRDTKLSRIIHCEMNALLHARQLPTGCTLYTWPFLSCDRCVVHMLQAGIRHFVAPKPTDEALARWGAAFERTKAYIAECGASYKEIVP